MTLLLVFVPYAIGMSALLAREGFRWPNAPTGETRKDRDGKEQHRPPRRVLIIGATGGTGRQLVSQALERGYAVTAFARDPTRLQIDHPQLKMVPGDVMDVSTVEAAMQDQDAVISALGHKRFFYPTRILSEGTRNILQAMDSRGVPRLVCETALGIGDSAGRMGLYYTLFVIPLILPFYFWDKTRQERLITRSNVDWVIIRPGALTNGQRRGRYRHGRRVGSFLWTMRISRSDVAEFMLNQLTSDAYLGAAPGVCS